MEHESVQHDVERSLWQVKPTGMPDERVIGAASLDNGPDRRWVGIDRRQAKARGGEEVSVGTCPAANRQHDAILEPNPPRDEVSLLCGQALVVDVAHRLACEPVKHVIGAVRATPDDCVLVRRAHRRFYRVSAPYQPSVAASTPAAVGLGGAATTKSSGAP